MTRRLLLSYLTITLVVLILLELPLAIFYQQREAERLTADVERDATVMATIYEDVLQEGLTPDPVFATDYAGNTGARVIVVDVDGITIVDSDREAARDYSTRPEIDDALTGVRASGTRRSDTLDTELLYVAVPVASGGTVHGAVRITFDTEEMNERVQRFWIGLVAIAAIVLLVTTVVGWLLARSVTRPIRRLQAAAERFSHGDLTPIDSDPNDPPELVALENDLNDMARQLDDIIERQRSFVADASHQLRTPLTALRLRLENLHSVTPTGESADELSDAIDETTRLSALANDLLQLARTEQHPATTTVDLARLVRDRVDIWTATAELEGVGLELQSDAASRWSIAIEGGIEQVLDNLLDNAIRAAPEGSTVTVTVTGQSATHTIAIADEGPGLSEVDKSNALERFWRGNTSSEGTGLGLTIAHAIIAASGGQLGLHDHSPHGLVATIELTATDPPPDDAATRTAPPRRGLRQALRS